MTNATLKTTIQNVLTGSVREDARIEYTQHGNSYCVCIRVPHDIEYTVKVNGVPTIKKSVGYSLPAHFRVWGIQTEQRIRDVITEFLHYNQHLVA